MVTRITSLVKNALSKSLTRLFTAEKFDFAPFLLGKEFEFSIEFSEKKLPKWGNK